MQLFSGMFSTVAWSVTTMVLLTLTSTALPTAPSDGLMRPRSGKTGTLIRRAGRSKWPQSRRKAYQEVIKASNTYQRCLYPWYEKNSDRMLNPFREGLPSEEEDIASFKLAEQECFEQAVRDHGVKPRRLDKKSFGELMAALPWLLEEHSTDSWTMRHESRHKITGDSRPQDAGEQDRGGRPNVNPMTLIQPRKGPTMDGALNIIKNAFFKSDTGGQHRRAPFWGSGVPPIRLAPG